jgi:hypothetical protein
MSKRSYLNSQLVAPRDHLLENVTLPSGLHRAHVTAPDADPHIEDWLHLLPDCARLTGAWAYIKDGLHHLVMTWKEE